MVPSVQVSGLGVDRAWSRRWGSCPSTFVPNLGKAPTGLRPRSQKGLAWSSRWLHFPLRADLCRASACALAHVLPKATRPRWCNSSPLAQMEKLRFRKGRSFRVFQPSWWQSWVGTQVCPFAPSHPYLKDPCPSLEAGPGPREEARGRESQEFKLGELAGGGWEAWEWPAVRA